MQRALVVLLARVDEAIDALVYRPAIVKAFAWMPRWWQCDLAKLSCRLDDRWATGYWEDDGRPSSWCEACERRAASLQIGGRETGSDGGDHASFLDDRVVRLCGWCQLRGPILDEDDFAREIEAARRASISWRWRWTSRRC